MNEKIIFDIVLALLLIFLIVSTFVDYYKITHPCVSKIKAKVLCVKTDTRCIVESIDVRIVTKMTCTVTFEYNGHRLEYSGDGSTMACLPGMYYYADIDVARYLHDKSSYFTITQIYPDPNPSYLQPYTPPCDATKED